MLIKKKHVLIYHIGVSGFLFFRIFGSVSVSVFKVTITQVRFFSVRLFSVIFRLFSVIFRLFSVILRSVNPTDKKRN